MIFVYSEIPKNIFISFIDSEITIKSLCNVTAHIEGVVILPLNYLSDLVLT